MAALILEEQFSRRIFPRLSCCAGVGHLSFGQPVAGKAWLGLVI